MASAGSVRWGVLRSLATAVRATTRPGSPSLGARVACLPRLLHSVRRGEYAGTTVGRLLLLASAMAYVLSPVDFMPEVILPLVGLADDAMVLSWVAVTLVNETEQFLSWEKRRSPQAQTARRPHGASWPPPQDSRTQPEWYPQDRPVGASWDMPQDRTVPRNILR